MFGNKKKNRFSFNSISPEDVFLDSKNMPNFDSRQLEGKMEKPIARESFWGAALVFCVLSFLLFFRAGYLQVVKGESYRIRSENNHLRSVLLMPERGLVYDKNGELLIWNEPDRRAYKNLNGLAHVLGYTGFSFEELVGKGGVEESFNDILKGQYGEKLIETDSKNQVKSESIQKLAFPGESLYLTIDSRIQEKIYEIFSKVSNERGFQGAALIILDVNNGEILALVSYPEFNPQILSDGRPEELVNSYLNDNRKPFLNRAISGLYTPGSVVKPILAIAALNEKIISSEKQIFSSGSISIPNPYAEGQPSVFKDWKAHGWVDLKRALAVSSNVYFYSVGGGYEEIKGLGIKKLDEYFSCFGLAQKTGINLSNEASGVLPGLKAQDALWRVGDTYNASIGQGNFQVTPIQMAVAGAALANNGYLVSPRLTLSEEIKLEKIKQNISEDYYKEVREGMRMSAVEGTASALGNLPFKIAAKTGTAELGSGAYVNSWLISFWPYEKPRYAMAVVLEKGLSSNLVGGVYVASELFQWMVIHTPEYLTN